MPGNARRCNATEISFELYDQPLHFWKVQDGAWETLILLGHTYVLYCPSQYGEELKTMLRSLGETVRM